jgi:glutathione S-transferase
MMHDARRLLQDTYWQPGPNCAPFGQLPKLTDRKNGVVVAQSAAIAVYAARLTELDGGADLKAYANTLQYIELEQELMQHCGKALYTGEAGTKEREQAWVAAKEHIDERLAYVVANLGENRFIFPGSTTPTAADFAVAVCTWFLSSPALWGGAVKDAFPALARHLNDVIASNPKVGEVLAEMDEWEAYYKI